MDPSLLGSRRHKTRDCPQQKPPVETPRSDCKCSQSLPNSGEAKQQGETLTDKCKCLREELESAELARISAEYEACAEVDRVVGSVGPLYYACVEVEGISTEGLVDSGSSATILSFQLFKQIGRQAKIPSSALQKPDHPPRDYS